MTNEPTANELADALEKVGTFDQRFQAAALLRTQAAEIEAMREATSKHLPIVAAELVEFLARLDAIRKGER